MASEEWVEVDRMAKLVFGEEHWHDALKISFFQATRNKLEAHKPETKNMIYRTAYELLMLATRLARTKQVELWR